jgi:hypothetical protein
MKSRHVIFATANWLLLSLAAITAPAGAQQPVGNDLRDIRIGMAVSDLPAAG